ncbi:HAUS1 protein, partial [Atrichornis clamosus]|nr:HAUS1 protein [Atrichornis clamosus]
QVTLWLKKIYGDLPIPKYEVNERTVDILHDVMECNEETDREISLMIEDMKQQAIKDEEKTVYWQDVLREGLGLSVDNLSEEATAYLNDLVESAITLKVKDMSLASLFCAISDMTSELFETKSKTQELELELNNIQKKVTSAVMMEKRLQEDNFKIEESQRKENARILSRSKNLKFLKYKFEDLKISIKDAEELLIARGLNQSLTHEALMKFSE